MGPQERAKYRRASMATWAHWAAGLGRLLLSPPAPLPKPQVPLAANSQGPEYGPQCRRGRASAVAAGSLIAQALLSRLGFSCLAHSQTQGSLATPSFQTTRLCWPTTHPQVFCAQIFLLCFISHSNPSSLMVSFLKSKKILRSKSEKVENKPLTDSSF